MGMIILVYGVVVYAAFFVSFLYLLAFVAGDMLKLFTPEFVDEHGRPDVLIVDPPRAGLHPKVVKQIKKLKPERLVYVS